MNSEPQLLYGVFSEGMDSYLRELPREDCPYASGSAEWVAWLRGWDQTAHGKRHSYPRLSLNERAQKKASRLRAGT
jgi:hypothetical protein